MGFRDLAKFNIALLAKQWWRLITKPGSLAARLIRAKYYPTSSFLNANLGSSPSLIWRSIWSSRKLLELGMGWRIGNGQSVLIWNDFWLPSFPPERISSPQRADLQKVSDIIHSPSGGWNEPLIRSSFTTEEADRILAIPISSSGQEDVRVWLGEGSGIYSVRSGYRVLLNPSENSSGDNIFNHLWSLDCPSKVKI
ncbi:hypothetical protein like AT4G29090 [Hibiscus trionum]|uniref:Reverse transcriptase n=1 Tax=Hibiscus trionum TaxID=183268 RepID=A0A9W7IH02_HIBTR|nr:hypothetical protein like AT4G29090 [Hibiscus trionum]